MAKTRKRTEVSVETETTIHLRRGAGEVRAWCEDCRAVSLMLAPEAAASVARVTTRVIYARVEHGSLHFSELPDGSLLVCGSSLGLNQR